LLPILIPYPAHLEEQWQTRRGAAVMIRPIRPADAEIEQAFVRGLSSESKYMRFMELVKELSPQLLKRFTEIDYAREMALIAVHLEQGSDGQPRETQIAVARYVTNADGRSCEFAVVVADDWRRHGLGQKLMQRLMECARGAGLAVITGEVLADNQPMLELMRRLGFSIRANPGDARVRLVSRPLALPA
jgi:acetyltransferase